MKIRIFPAFATCVIIGLCATAQEVKPAQEKVKTAQAAADKWLKLMDTGDYAQSWEDAAQYFKAAVTKEDWRRLADATRAPLGRVVSRKLLSAKYMTQLPGAPDGEYVVVQYASSLEHKKEAVETVSAKLDNDRTWRVAGYFIK